MGLLLLRTKVEVRNLGNQNVNQGVDDQVTKLDDHLCLLSLKMEPVGGDVVEDVACRVEAGTQVR